MSDIPTHSSAFRFRRFLNWFPMGLTYAFLYMGRYNLTVSKNALGDQLMTKEDFGIIFAAGTLTYAFAFLINGPLTDRIGGRKALLAGALGSGVLNLIMGLYISSLVGSGTGADTSNLTLIFSILYAVNMYFQSFGAVAIVKVNAFWFHVRERGGFSGIFGTMISSGIFFAFTVNRWILDFARGDGSEVAASKWVFFAPSAVLLLMFFVEIFLLRDRPGQAGHEDFDTGDASSGEGDVRVPTLQLLKRILTNPIIITVALIEFCTGVLRNGVMHWYPIYAKEVLTLPGDHFMRAGSWSEWYTIVPFFLASVIFFIAGAKTKGKRRGISFVSGGLLFLVPFMQGGWGGILMVAGVIGGNVAGWLSDLLFQSRRAPTAGFLYLGLALAAVLMFFTLGGTTMRVGWSKMEAGGGFDALQEGDEILAMAGSKELEDWGDVSRAVACIPATCQGEARWDTERCICSTSPHKTEDGLQVSQGFIDALVLRNERRVEIRLKDPSPTMRAGDKRRLKVGPVLTMSPIWLGLAVFFVSLCVIGTHGLLSGTATMDFGGRKGAATAVGIIDGFVYLGTGVQSLCLGFLTTRSWSFWPPFLIPFALIGFILLLRIWKEVPGGRRGGH